MLETVSLMKLHRHSTNIVDIMWVDHRYYVFNFRVNVPYKSLCLLRMLSCNTIIFPYDVLRNPHNFSYKKKIYKDTKTGN